MVKPPPPPPPRDEGGEGRFSQRSDPKWSRLALWLAMFAILALFFLPSLSPSDTGDEISFDDLIEQTADGEVAVVEFNNLTGEIEGNFVATDAELEIDPDAVGAAFTSDGPIELSEGDRAILDPVLVFDTPQSSIWASLLPLLLPISLLILFFWWMQRREQGQIGGIMSIGLSLIHI